MRGPGGMPARPPDTADGGPEYGMLMGGIMPPVDGGGGAPGPPMGGRTMAPGGGAIPPMGAGKLPGPFMGIKELK